MRVALSRRDGEEWRPVTGVTDHTTDPGRSNIVRFDPVETTGLRIDLQLRPEYCAGIREWRVLEAVATGAGDE